MKKEGWVLKNRITSAYLVEPYNRLITELVDRILKGKDSDYSNATLYRLLIEPYTNIISTIHNASFLVPEIEIEIRRHLKDIDSTLSIFEGTVDSFAPV